jgi:hypothetical protein
MKTHQPPTKEEQKEKLQEAIDLVNRVRCELKHYYPSMKESELYKTNCNIDHDRLFKAIEKLNQVQTEFETVK